MACQFHLARTVWGQTPQPDRKELIEQIVVDHGRNGVLSADKFASMRWDELPKSLMGYLSLMVTEEGQFSIEALKITKFVFDFR